MVHKLVSRLGIMIAVMISISAALPMRADQNIQLRSGNGAVGSRDAQVRFVSYPNASTPPTAATFTAVQTGAFAYIDAPYTTYIKQLPSDPLAQWVGTTSALGAGSAIYAIPFKVTDSVIAAATLNFGYAVDNAIYGLYINGTSISNFANDGDYHGEYYYMRSDIASLLKPNTTNWLYIVVYDGGYLSGLMFSANITTFGAAPGAPTITPTTGGTAGQVTFRIVGSGFEAGSAPGSSVVEAPPTVTLTGEGSTTPATNVKVVSPNILTGTFDLTKATTGVKTVTVTNRDGTSSTLSNAFTVEAKGGPNVLVQTVGTPAVLGRIEWYFLTVINLGDVDSGATSVSVALEPWQTFLAANPTPSTIDSLVFPANPFQAVLTWDISNIPPGGSTIIAYGVEQDPTFPSGDAVITTACTSYQLSVIRGYCEGQLQANLLLEDTVCSGFPDINDSCVQPVTKDYSTFDKCMLKEGAMCSSSSSDVRSSIDPNDLAGPSGYGTPEWIQAPPQMAYALAFNNLPTATNPATNVYVSDTFDSPSLDLTTLTASAVTIGNTAYALSNIPLAEAPFSQDIDLRPGQNLIVRVSGSLNSSTKQVSISLLSLDPATGLTPADPTVGFLAPNNGGSIVFAVDPKPALTTDTVINDSGSVVFDTNAAINTNVWSNTIDVTAPASKVASLPAATTNPSLNVSWSGTDVGSGIATYAVYVSDNGGTYSEWQTDVTATSATYSGTAGHTYAFYSIATDNVGNVEGAKTAPDTTVQVVPLVGTATAVTASANPANVGANVTFTASVSPASGNGVPTGTVTFNDGTTQLGTGTLDSSGRATYSTAALTAGSHSITAVYGGDATYTGSTSAVLAEVVAAPAFSLSVAPATLNVTQGQSGQATVTITPVGGFNSAIALSCSGVPVDSTCTLSPTSITPDGTNKTATATIAIATNVKTAATNLPSRPAFQKPSNTVLALVGAGGPILWFIRRRRRGKRRNTLEALTALGILAMTLMAISSCGGGGPKTPRGTSTITVTGTASSSTETATFTLTVQ